jgi:hypothetical protein
MLNKTPRGLNHENPETLHEKILATVNGGYLGMDWRVTDADGEPLKVVRHLNTVCT